MTTELRKITDYCVVDHGIDWAGYFPGCSTAHTPYDACVTGTGDTPAAALDDALETLAAGGEWDLDGLADRIRESDPWAFSDSPSAIDQETDGDAEDCGEFPSYYISLMLK